MSTETWEDRRAHNPWWYAWNPDRWLHDPDYMGEGLAAMWFFGVFLPLGGMAYALYRDITRKK